MRDIGGEGRREVEGERHWGRRREEVKVGGGVEGERGGHRGEEGGKQSLQRWWVVCLTANSTVPVCR